MKKENKKVWRKYVIPDGYYGEILISAIISCLLGFVLWWKVLLPLYTSKVPNWILVAVLFFTVTFMHVLLTGTVEHVLKKIYPRDSPLEIRQVLLFAFFGSLIVGLLAGFLEFVYEVDFHRQPLPVPNGGVVYVIDDSGSMYSTDKDGKRNDCVIKMNDSLPEEAMSGLVRFSDKVDLFCEIAPLLPKHKMLMERYARVEPSWGGTDIEAGISKALDMCETSPILQEVSEMPHVLLLTDGQSGCDEDMVIQRCLSDGIIIDAISLGAGTDIGLLTRLTSGTGGTLTNAPSAFYLEGAFMLLTGREVKRCLLTPVLLITENRVKLRIMQVIFLFMIGLAIETVVTLMLAYKIYVRQHIRNSPVLIFVSSILLMLTDASLVIVFLMLGCFLCPFFVGRKFQGVVRKQRVVDPKLYAGHWGELIGKVENDYFCKN